MSNNDITNEAGESIQEVPIEDLVEDPWDQTPGCKFKKSIDDDPWRLARMMERAAMDRREAERERWEEENLPLPLDDPEPTAVIPPAVRDLSAGQPSTLTLDDARSRVRTKIARATLR